MRSQPRFWPAFRYRAGFERDAKVSGEVVHPIQTMGIKPVRTAFRSPWQKDTPVPRPVRHTTQQPIENTSTSWTPLGSIHNQDLASLHEHIVRLPLVVVHETQTIAGVEVPELSDPGGAFVLRRALQLVLVAQHTSVPVHTSFFDNLEHFAGIAREAVPPPQSGVRRLLVYGGDREQSRTAATVLPWCLIQGYPWARQNVAPST